MKTHMKMTLAQPMLPRMASPSPRRGLACPSTSVAKRLSFFLPIADQADLDRASVALGLRVDFCGRGIKKEGKEDRK